MSRCILHVHVAMILEAPVTSSCISASCSPPAKRVVFGCGSICRMRGQADPQTLNRDPRIQAEEG